LRLRSECFYFIIGQRFQFWQRFGYCRRSGLFITEISKETLPEAKIFPFSNLQISLEKGKIFSIIFTKRSKNYFNPAFLAMPCWQKFIIPI